MMAELTENGRRFRGFRATSRILYLVSTQRHIVPELRRLARGVGANGVLSLRPDCPRGDVGAAWHGEPEGFRDGVLLLNLGALTGDVVGLIDLFHLDLRFTYFFQDGKLWRVELQAGFLHPYMPMVSGKLSEVAAKRLGELDTLQAMTGKGSTPGASCASSADAGIPRPPDNPLKTER